MVDWPDILEYSVEPSVTRRRKPEAEREARDSGVGRGTNAELGAKEGGAPSDPKMEKPGAPVRLAGGKVLGGALETLSWKESI